VAATAALFGVLIVAVHLVAPDAVIDWVELPLVGVLALANVVLVRLHLGGGDSSLTTAPESDRIRQLVRDCSHEFRTPITIAKGHTELLRQSCSDDRGVGDQDALEDIDVVLNELDRLSRLTDRLLILAAAGDAGFLVPQRLQPESIVVDVARRWGAAAARDWKILIHDDQPIVADSTRLTSALDALVENAVRHTKPGDEIAIEVRGRRGVATIHVRDTGCGIPARQVVRLLNDPGTARLHGDRRPGGTGLGLGIVKAIAEAHGGWVTIDSRPGRGTTFALHLPQIASLRPGGPAPAAAAISC
jgi:signal transduction histidine kinase